MHLKVWLLLAMSVQNHDGELINLIRGPVITSSKSLLVLNLSAPYRSFAYQYCLQTIHKVACRSRSPTFKAWEIIIAVSLFFFILASDPSLNERTKHSSYSPHEDYMQVGV